jgi:penicillin-binding protein 2
MYLDKQDRRPAITPKLALRVAIIGGAALALFAIVFFRLWYLQILSGDEYRAEANENRVREIKVSAPRGEIVDRNGRTLVENRVGLAVKLAPNEIPEEAGEREALYERIGEVLDVPGPQIERRVDEQLDELPFSAATVEQDVDLPVIQYVLENQEDFPGVTVERVFLRSYPHEELGAHLFGTVGEVTEEQLGQDQRYTGVELGDRVGQSGVEYTYDRFLRGENGATRVVVDALGNFQGEAAVEEPVQGRQLRLGVDLDVQEAGQAAIAGAEAAFVVMDVQNGEVLGMGSSPSFDPNMFSRIIKPSDYERLTDEENGAPLTNRATQGLYPTGSTWKLVTATAALQEGLIGTGSVLVDDGGHSVGTSFFANAGGASYGPLALPEALKVSSDDFFYQLGEMANNGQEIQEWAAKYGFGKPTGVDLPGELGGLIPTPEWRNDLYDEGLTDRPWSVGDNINFSIGQGDLQATPLQLAVAYAAIANGGTVVQPHLGMRIEGADGEPIQELEHDGARELDIDPEHRTAILDGLHRAATEAGGTSASVFAGFPIEVAGKTGTAEKGLGRADQSWYAALAPYPNPKYVVVATFEAGGFGAETAAPAVREILAALFEVKDEGAVAGDLTAID